MSTFPARGTFGPCDVPTIVSPRPRPSPPRSASWDEVRPSLYTPSLPGGMEISLNGMENWSFSQIVLPRLAAESRVQHPSIPGPLSFLQMGEETWWILAQCQDHTQQFLMRTIHLCFQSKQRQSERSSLFMPGDKLPSGFIFFSSATGQHIKCSVKHWKHCHLQLLGDLYSSFLSLKAGWYSNGTMEMEYVTHMWHNILTLQLS